LKKVRLVIIGKDGANDHICADVQTGYSHIETVDGFEYKADLRKGWSKKFGVVNGWLKGRESDHLCIFYRGNSDQVTGPSDNAVSASNLRKAYEYRGVPGALKDEFSKPKNFPEIPWYIWAVGLVVVIAVAIFFLSKEGIIFADEAVKVIKK